MASVRKLVGASQVRRAMQLRQPVIRPAVAPPARGGQASTSPVDWGGRKGTGRRWHRSHAKTTRKKSAPAATCYGQTDTSSTIHLFYQQKLTSVKISNICLYKHSGGKKKQVLAINETRKTVAYKVSLWLHVTCKGFSRPRLSTWGRNLCRRRCRYH